MGNRTDLGSITDVAGVLVGHANRTDGGYLTGITVVIAPPGTVGGVDVRGGGPGTHETDALDPRTLVPTVDAIALTGGSAFGLIAAHGVQRWLEEQGRGYPAAPGINVPIVPAAVIFDLGRGGDPSARPTEEMGYQAAAAAGTSVARGNVGAGTGAVVASLMFKGGEGTASGSLSGPNEGVVVGALAVVNALGAPQFRLPDGVATGASAAPAPAAGGPASGAANTTLVVVATNATLDKAQASRLATVAHDGFARALDPVHTLADGDTAFALATGEVGLAANPLFGGQVGALVELHALCATVVRLAILDAVASAKPVVTAAGRWERYPVPDGWV